MTAIDLDRLRDRHLPTLSQAITTLERGEIEDRALLGRLHAAGGGAHVIGVTGAPGSGKSTLVSALTAELRRRGRTVGIVAVDPSSSVSGGAILGDRIRMLEHTLDSGVYVRSLSTRGALGGVSRATVDAVSVLDAAGFDVVIVETVGVGQAEVDIVRIAHTTAVVSVPGLGDDIQAIKAGLLEVADIHVVNKADRPGADRTAAELLAALMLGAIPGPGAWVPPVLSTQSVTGDGVPALVERLDAHRAWLSESGELARRERRSAGARVTAIIDGRVAARLRPYDDDAHVLGEVAARRLDPHSAADVLLGDLVTNPRLEDVAT